MTFQAPGSQPHSTLPTVNAAWGRLRAMCPRLLWLSGDEGAGGAGPGQSPGDPGPW